MTAVIWSIAGSDNSGGAGIQADLQTISQLGALAPLHLCTLVTAVTAQGPAGLIACQSVDVRLLQQQAQSLLPEHAPAVIKTGLLCNPQQLDWVIGLVQQLKQQNPQLLVVCDPVKQCSSGGELSELQPQHWQRFWPYVDVLTPNLPELQYLSSQTNPATAADWLLQQGVKAVLIKGGHSDSALAQDQLRINPAFRYRGFPAYPQQVTLASPKLAGNRHGTGCVLSAALAGALAQGFALEDAFVLAKVYIQQGIQQAVQLGNYCHNGHRAVDASSTLPQLHCAVPAQPLSFPPLSAPLGLYLVLPDYATLALAVAAGAKTVQLRLKQQTDVELRRQISAAITLCRQHQVQLFINDHWQLAIELGAYGVHLGQEDVDQANLQAIAHAGLRLGLSCHGLYKLLRAEQLQPSYLAIGAVFATQTKDMSGKLQGLDKLPLYRQLFRQRPLVAIGGITPQNAAAVLSTGIRHLALVSAFVQAEYKPAFVRQLQQLIEEFPHAD
ncbi:thiamine phosphate synthase [Rheinheimera marina]|uniref:Thiamine-phosphate synthase n=1 Tax=Rheinheimera marina TaxID=1774958 RepID=A0ABV9JHE1_9GAMM